MPTGSKGYRDAVSAVTALLALHDPLGLGEPDGSLPSNEYSMEAAEVVRRAGGASSMAPADVSGVIAEVLEEHFGADDVGGRGDYLGLAREVCKILDASK